jgi:hypothetical protein
MITKLRTENQIGEVYFINSRLACFCNFHLKNLLRKIPEHLYFVLLRDYYLCCSKSKLSMKKIALFVSALALLSACKSNTNEGDTATETATDTLALAEDPQAAENHYYGDSITEDNAINASTLLALMAGKDSVNLKLSGVANSSCQKKGCWMKMDIGDGQEIRVNFKDYGFFVPKNLNGELAIVEGVAYVDTINVEFLKHLAEDAGKSEEEIAAISEPEISVNFTANGVIIKS